MVTSSPPALGLACEAAEADVMAREPVEKGRWGPYVVPGVPGGVGGHRVGC